MSEGRLTRKSLFDVIRKPVQSTLPATKHEQPAPPPSFSVAEFYRSRAEEASGPHRLPVLGPRAALPQVATTRIGNGAANVATAPRGESGVVAFAGTARVRQHTCLAWQRSFCSVCAERCPVPGAIVMTQGRPSVDQARCTGCGVCVTVCPAPINGFDIVPTTEVQT